LPWRRVRCCYPFRVSPCARAHSVTRLRKSTRFWGGCSTKSQGVKAARCSLRVVLARHLTSYLLDSRDKLEGGSRNDESLTAFFAADKCGHRATFMSTLRRRFKFSIRGRVLVAHWPRASGDSALLHTPCHSSTCPGATLEPSSGPPPVVRMKSLARRALSGQGTLHISP
jgi:hypothetical protein